MTRSLLRRASAVAGLAWWAHPMATGLVPLAAAWSTKLVLDGLGHRAGPAALLPAALALALTGLLCAAAREIRLFGLGGAYARLFAMQARGYEAEPPQAACGGVRRGSAAGSGV